MRFCLVWDNTQKLVRTRDSSRSTGNKMLLWANAFAARNRVQNCVTSSRATVKAVNLPITAFLPTHDDYCFLRERMVTMISRILVHHVDYFRRHCSTSVVYHVPHQFSHESSMKSELVLHLRELLFFTAKNQCGFGFSYMFKLLLVRKKCLTCV
jgi:hypothetical protein